jgi:hypothetical protein
VSAFIVSERCMHRAVHALMPPDASCEACNEMGRQLHQLNAEAVSQRYSCNDPVPEYRYAAFLPSLIQQYKSLACLLYQCTEGNIPQTALYQSMQQRKIELAFEIVANLEEYRRADWD